jgi:long-subunit acyl-CoA synthetase (AMP-forming)
VELTRDGASVRLEVLDRAGDLCKLSNGEYLCPGKVEAVLEASPLISHALVAALVSIPYSISLSSHRL